MLEIISYWSDKLSSILDYFTFFPQKKYFTQRCIQSASLSPGTHSFFFWTQRILNEGSNWTQKKDRMFMQKHSDTRYANLGFVKTIFIN